jgi:hypothetical protein
MSQTPAQENGRKPSSIFRYRLKGPSKRIC